MGSSALLFEENCAEYIESRAYDDDKADYHRCSIVASLEALTVRVGERLVDVKLIFHKRELSICECINRVARVQSKTHGIWVAPAVEVRLSVRIEPSDHKVDRKG